MYISEVHLEVFPCFIHVELHTTSCNLPSVFLSNRWWCIHLCSYFLVINWLPRVQSERLDLEGALHKVRKGGVGFPRLLEMRLIFWNHKQVDQVLCNYVRKDIPRPRVLKSAMEVPHPGDVSGGGCFLRFLLDRLLNVEPLLLLSKFFDVRPHQISLMYWCWPNQDDRRRARLRGDYIWRVCHDEGVLIVQEDFPHVPVLPVASLHEYSCEVFIELLMCLYVPIVVSLRHLL